MNRTARNRSFATSAAAGVLMLALSGAAAWAQPALDPVPNPASDPLNGPATQTDQPQLLLPGQPPPPGVPVANTNPNPPAPQQQQQQPPAQPAGPADAAGAGQVAPQRQTFSQAELDEMLAPVALYPDSLLSQVLMASTYPVEVVQADRWRRANTNLAGDALATELEKQPWDPSVKSLVNTPDVLSMMSDKLDWTVRLGDAFIGQQQQVMDTVQDLRRRAQEAGTLKTTPEQRVTTLVQAEPVVEREIVIERTDPDVVYVPVYDPYVAYGPWWHPYHRPFFWCPPTYPFGWSGIWFGLSYHCGPAWGYAWGHPDWHHRHFNLDVHRHERFNHTINRTLAEQQINRRSDAFRVASGTWVHDPSHRRGVWYRDTNVAQRFGAPTPTQSTRDRNSTWRSRTAGGSGSGSGTTSAFMGPRVTTPSNAGRTTTGNRVPNTEDFMGPRVTTPSNAGRTTNDDLVTNEMRNRDRVQIQRRPPVLAPGLDRDDASANRRNVRGRDDDGGGDNNASVRQQPQKSDRVRVIRPEPVRVRQPDLSSGDRGAAFSEVNRDGGSVRVESRRGSISRAPSSDSSPGFRSAPAPRMDSSPGPSMRSSPPPSRSFSSGDGGGSRSSSGSSGGGGGGGGNVSKSSPAPAATHGNTPSRR
jgi:hypothetical protein